MFTAFMLILEHAFAFRVSGLRLERKMITGMTAKIAMMAVMPMSMMVVVLVLVARC